MLRLDRYDLAILEALQRDARATWLELGEQVNLSASACQRRVRSLQARGVLKRFTVDVDLGVLGYDVHAFLSVNVDRRDIKLANQFRKTIDGYPEVLACHMLSGNVDFILEVVSRDLPSYGRFVEERILSLPGVKDASSALVLETVKSRPPALGGR
jgi:Lrp/AsnC family transcriptional regulator, leucine-responsive regulatory protein